VLCRDVYHCTPTELAKVPARVALAHLTCLSVENKVREMEARKAARKAGAR